MSSWGEPLKAGRMLEGEVLGSPGKVSQFKRSMMEASEFCQELPRGPKVSVHT